MLEGILAVWFLFVILSLAFTAYDVSKMPISWVQKLGWILVVAYTGPIGLFFYLLTCRSPGPGLHDVYTQAHWKQSINSEVHCLAGDASGIIVAAIVLSFFSLPNGIELILEYVTAFLFGLLVFQAGMMRSMYSSYGEAVRKTFFAETTSMNCVMIGMIPTMVIMMGLIENARNPAHLAFWFTMGIATVVGGITAYPINSWLVKNKLKHGCMTLPESASSEEPAHAMHHEHMEDQMDHSMGSLPLNKQWIIIGGTFALLLVAGVVTSLYVPIRFF